MCPPWRQINGGICGGAGGGGGGGGENHPRLPVIYIFMNTSYLRPNFYLDPQFLNPG